MSALWYLSLLIACRVCSQAPDYEVLESGLSSGSGGSGSGSAPGSGDDGEFISYCHMLHS